MDKKRFPKSRGSRDTPSEDTTLDLGSGLDVDLTAAFDTSKGPGMPGGPSFGVEADIILIAHPEDKMLGTRYRLPPNNVLEIGRSIDADISLPDVRSLSRSHARLRHLGVGVEVEDLGSTNGTYINDVAVNGSHALRSGDRFQVGAVHFKFVHERDPEHAYHEAIHQLVVCDGLTQALNRRSFDQELEREFKRALRHDRPLSLVLFDIDHFKNVNDTYGHLCGDFVLQKIARQTNRFLRPEQVFARVGGEEFVILSPEIGIEGGRTFAEKLREDFEREHYTYAGVTLRITCSFGVAELIPEIENPELLYAAADRAMYQSKHQGRNRVTVYQPES